MRTYVYQAALHCEDCGRAICERLTASGQSPANPEDESSFDSDEFPKGPYSASESDSPDHCDSCFLRTLSRLT
jgi:hypothetical protein